jgi:DNA polymerase-3 subunit gamma/tau
MASQALYLKWRPQRFEDVVGQEHVTQTLENALRAGRIAHAYLFAGPRGTGKTTMARLLAKAVNCQDEDVSNRPCNVCHICRSINDGRLLDLIEMDAASHTGVDNVREAIRDKVGFRPTEARYKVYVIDEVHMLSTSAFNALLKTLEEPPEHVIFVLATTEPHKVLLTIRSRCQRFDFRQIPLSALEARLRYIAGEEEIRVADDALRFIARASTGSARDAISLLDQLTAYGDQVITVDRLQSVLGLGDVELVRELVTHLVQHDVGGGLDVISQAVEGGADTRQFAQQVVACSRALLLLSIDSDADALQVDEETRARMSALVGQISVRDLVRVIRLFSQAQLDLRGTEQNQLALELAYVEASLLEEEPEPRPGLDSGERGTAAARSKMPERRPASETRAAAASVPPAAPPRTGRGTSNEPAEPSPAAREDRDATAQRASVSLDEVLENWAQIVQAIKEASPPVATFVHSAALHQVRHGNEVVLEFRGAKNDPTFNFSAKKLEEDGNKRIVERALRDVLGRPCRVRCEVTVAAREPSPQPAEDSGSQMAAAEGDSEDLPAAPADTETTGRVATAYRDAVSDPVVQDLLSRGGQVIDVETWSEDEGEE